MAVTITDFGGDERVELEGVVLSSRRTTVHVSSDHAMIDSGNRLRVTYWNADAWAVSSIDYRTDDHDVVARVDAGPDVRDLAIRYRKMAAWWRGVLDRYTALVEPVVVGTSASYWTAGQDLTNIRVGDVVEVYKGRKCPLGTYEVALIGENDYGHYVHLRDAAGVWHRYINPDNLRRPAPTTAQLAEAAGVGGEFGAILTGVLAMGCTAHDWLVVADWLRDKGKDDDAMILRGLVAARYQLRPEEAGVGA